MTPLKAARTIRFRLTALYAGLFLLSLALLFALVYWRTAAGVGLLLAVVGGVFLSGGFLRRISEINATADAIMTGHLGSRIPIRGTGDEIDQLSEKLNQMLDRLYDVMEGLRQVSTDIAHDLRTPLSRLKQELEADEALALFAALLRIAQIESGSRRTHFADVDLSALLMTLAEVYGPVAEEADHALRAAVEPGIHVVGDAELLTQMFVNLIENALRHTPALSVVEITLARGPGCARAEIADNGPGIPAAHRLNVLKRFYRLDASRTTPGHGLGLALVSAIAHLHEARLSLADNEPGLNAVLIFDVSNGQPAPSETHGRSKT